MTPKILIYDRGGFVPFAQAVVTDDDEDTLFFSEWRDVAPASKNAMVGRGVPGLTRVDAFWSYIEDADVLAFGDCGDGDMQNWLRKQGLAVWGTSLSEILELDRYELKKLLAKLDMPIVDTRRVIGLDALKSILREENDLYIKTSWFRADLETFKHETYHMSRSWLTDLKHRLGPHAEEIELLVEQPIEGCEIGYEGFTVDGKFPQRCAYGLELKDSAYIGMATTNDELPACLREANDAMGEALGMLGARGNYHVEVRVTDEGVSYVTDPCCRAGSPPFGSMSIWIDNWREIVIAGAHGDIVEPHFLSTYAAEIELRSNWAESDFLPLEIPKAALPFVRLRRPTVVDGEWWVVPHPWLDIIGSAVGLGESPEEAIDNALGVAKEVHGHQVEYNRNAKDELLSGWKEANEACEPATRRTATG